MKRSLVFISCVVAFGLMLSACASAPTTAPAAPAATTAPAAATEVPLNLVENGKLLVCSNPPYPPMESLDEKGEWKGMDVDLGNEIANRLGVKAQFVNTVWDTIISSLLSGKCDVIMSSMSVTPSRNKQISFIPYYTAGISFLAQKGNPENINNLMDLCGKKVAAQSGTYEVDFLQGTVDYLDNGVTQQCIKDGKKAVDVVVTQSDSDALQQLLTRKVAAYAADSPVALYYLLENSDKFQAVGEIYDSGPYGIGIPCGASDCSTAPFSDVGKAIDTAFKAMLADGTYGTLLKKWNLTAGSIK